MEPLMKFDRVYLSLVDLLRAIEAEFGNAHPIFETLDDWRVELLATAPAGWSVDDLIDPPAEATTNSVQTGTGLVDPLAEEEA